VIKTKSRTERTEGAENRVFGRENALTDRVIAAAIEVHRHLGPGLLESAYEECLCHELALMGVPFQRQLPLPISYKGLTLTCAYKLDLLVEDTVIVEIKAVEDFAPIHHSQLLTYLKLTNKRVGLLINFHVPVLKNGLKRIVNRYAGPALAPKSSAPSALETSPIPTSTSSSVTPDSQKSSATTPPLRVSAFNDARKTEQVAPKSSVPSASPRPTSVTPDSPKSSATTPPLRVSAFNDAPKPEEVAQ
jgi:GxxExxY protein